MSDALNLICPPPDQRLDLQAAEKAWYFSGASQVVLFKHGISTSHETSPQDGSPSPCLVARQTAPFQVSMDGTAIWEAPLHPAAAEALGLSCTPRSVQSLSVRPSGGTWSPWFQRPKIRVRRIPELGGAFPEPAPFASKDPKWQQTNLEVTLLHKDHEWEVLWEFRVDGEPGIQPFLIQKGNHLVCLAPMLDLLVERHGFPELTDAGYFDTVTAMVSLDLELAFFRTLLSFCNDAGHPIELKPSWPPPFSSCLTVRHDVDRIPETGTFLHLLAAYKKYGVKATWFWPTKTFDAQLIKQVVEQGHEVGLHTCARTFDDFVGELAFFRGKGIKIDGFSAHGGAGSGGYLGHRHHLWALETGLLYGEMLGRSNGLPHFAVTCQKGYPTPSPLVIPAVHLSLDKGTKPEAHALAELRKSAPEHLKDGRHVVVMNHPDIHVPELVELLSQLDLSDTWTATMQQCARHIMDRDSPPESAVKRTPYLSSAPARLLPPESLKPYFPAIEKVLKRYAMATNLKEPAYKSTLTTNTTQLGERAMKFLRSNQLEDGQTIMEWGCGFGFFAVALAILRPDIRIRALDRNETFLQYGRELLEEHPELADRVSFDLLDYAEEAYQGPFVDHLILYNTFCYIVGWRKQCFAMQSAAKALNPSGSIYFYHPNAWCPREPFTQLVGIHWLPRTLQNLITRKLGKRPLSDLDHQSPLRMWLLFKKTGLVRPEFFADGKTLMTWKTPSLWNCKYYAVRAYKPDCLRRDIGKPAALSGNGGSHAPIPDNHPHGIYYMGKPDQAAQELMLASLPGPHRPSSHLRFFSNWGSALDISDTPERPAHYLTPLTEHFGTATILRGGVPLPKSHALAAVYGSILKALAPDGCLYLQADHQRLDHEFFDQFFPSVQVESTKQNSLDWVCLRPSEQLDEDMEEIPCSYLILRRKMAALRQKYFAEKSIHLEPHLASRDDFNHAFTYSEHWALEASAIVKKIMTHFGLAYNAGRILEIGGSYGFLSCELALQGFDVTNIEPEKWRVEAIQPFLADLCGVGSKVQGSCGRMEELPITPEEYDATTFMGSLLYCAREDVKEVLKNVMSGLRPGGLLIVRENLHIEATASQNTAKLRRFTPHELHSLLQAHAGPPAYFCHLGIEREFEDVQNRWMVYSVVRKPT